MKGLDCRQHPDNLLWSDAVVIDAECSLAASGWNTEATCCLYIPSALTMPFQMCKLIIPEELMHTIRDATLIKLSRIASSLYDAFEDCMVNCVHGQWFLEIIVSLCSDFHDSIRPVFNAVPSSVAQTSSLVHRDFSRSLCVFWRQYVFYDNIWSLQISTPRNILKLFHNF